MRPCEWNKGEIQKALRPKLFLKLARHAVFEMKIGFGNPVEPDECKIQASFFASLTGSTF